MLLFVEGQAVDVDGHGHGVVALLALLALVALLAAVCGSAEWCLLREWRGEGFVRAACGRQRESASWSVSHTTSCNESFVAQHAPPCPCRPPPTAATDMRTRGPGVAYGGAGRSRRSVVLL